MIAEGITITTPTIIAVVVSLAGAVAFMFRMYAAGKEKEIANLEGEKKVYYEMAIEGVKSAKATADYYRGKYEDKPPIVLAAKVISEGSSPSTKAQRETAELATLRASLAAIKLEMGQTPRTEPEHKLE